MNYAPAACGKLLAGTFGTQLVTGWIVAVVTTVAGLAYSAMADMPTGSSLVSAFGVALLVCSLLSVAIRPAAPAAV